MISNDDVNLVLAYFNLQSPRQYAVQEIVCRAAIRSQFLAVARHILGAEPAEGIVRRLVALKRRGRIK